MVSLLLPTVLKLNCAPVWMVTLLATTWSALAFFVFSFHVSAVAFERESFLQS